MTTAEATRQYQAALESRRARAAQFEDCVSCEDERAAADDEVVRTKTAMWVAWMGEL